VWTTQIVTAVCARRPEGCSGVDNTNSQNLCVIKKQTALQHPISSSLGENSFFFHNLMQSSNKENVKVILQQATKGLEGE
jgi:hypothetical protein